MLYYIITCVKSPNHEVKQKSISVPKTSTIKDSTTLGTEGTDYAGLYKINVVNMAHKPKTEAEPTNRVPFFTKMRWANISIASRKKDVQAW